MLPRILYSFFTRLATCDSKYSRSSVRCPEEIHRYSVPPRLGFTNFRCPSPIWVPISSAKASEMQLGIVTPLAMSKRLKGNADVKNGSNNKTNFHSRYVR